MTNDITKVSILHKVKAHLRLIHYNALALFQADQLTAEADAVEEQQNREHTVQEVGKVVRILENSTVDVMADNTVSGLLHLHRCVLFYPFCCA